MQADTTVRILWFELAGGRYALRLATVQEVVRAVAVMPLPGAPAIVEGAIDVRGQLVPVLDIRSRFQLPSKPMDLADALIIARTSSGTVALRVDGAGWPVTVPDGEIEQASAIAKSPHVAGVCRLPEGLVVIHDLDSFLLASESGALADALAARQNPGVAT